MFFILKMYRQKQQLVLAASTSFPKWMIPFVQGFVRIVALLICLFAYIEWNH
jgi:hypothetical protein